MPKPNPLAKTLFALPDSYARHPDRPVADILQEANELVAIVKKHGKALYAKTRLDKRVAESLKARRSALASAESDWAKHRAKTTPKGLRALREEAEALKHDAIAALRYFVEEDEDVQAELDAIVVGTGLPDLIDDLEKLGSLLADHAAALKKADLPKKAASRARELARTLGEGTAAHATDREGAALLALRNRAFWFAREAMEAIRSAGRYAFRSEPALATLFRSSSRRGTLRGTRKGKTGGIGKGKGATNGQPAATSTA
jgi:hypothetical protein